MVVPETPLEMTKFGLRPAGQGWFIVSAREMRWDLGDFGAFCNFEGKRGFPDFGINLNVLQPGQSMGLYHRENRQEGFLVLTGTCLLIVEGEERELKTWDFFHCPPGTEHIILGAGDEPAVVLAVGARGRRRRGMVYPVSKVAQKHRAGVKKETTEPSEAYGGFAGWNRSLYQDGWLPDL
jgi:uncharacterized cupin superfamily protein